MVTLHNLQYIQLDSSFDVNVFAISCTMCFRRELRIFGHCSHILEPSKVGETDNFQRFCSIEKVRKIEAINIVSNYDVRVNLQSDLITSWTNCDHFSNSLSSVSNERMCVPTIFAQVFRVKTF
jgi:hypothetical protein